MSVTAPLDIDVEPDGALTTVTLRGVLDVATSGSLRTALLTLEHNHEHDLIVDLRTVEFIDSTGLGALISEQKRRRENDRQVKLVVAKGIIERLLRISGLIEVFAVYSSLDDARQNTRHISTLID